MSTERSNWNHARLISLLNAHFKWLRNTKRNCLQAKQDQHTVTRYRYPQLHICGKIETSTEPQTNNYDTELSSKTLTSNGNQVDSLDPEDLSCKSNVKTVINVLQSIKAICVNCILLCVLWSSFNLLTFNSVRFSFPLNSVNMECYMKLRVCFVGLMGSTIFLVYP